MMTELMTVFRLVGGPAVARPLRGQKEFKGGNVAKIGAVGWVLFGSVDWVIQRRVVLKEQQSAL